MSKNEVNDIAKDLSSILGFKNLAEVAPPKVPQIDHLFQQVSQQKQDVAFCIDGSGSTCFDSRASFDKRPFSYIYAEAVLELYNQLPKHSTICWSSMAKQLTGEELDQFNEAIKNKVPFAKAISNMGGGTEPQTILPFVKNKTTVLVTDGEIPENSIYAIKNHLANSGIGSVFLVIIPHIDAYANLYMDSQQVEASAKDSIRLSIPQAFSERLATVLIWNYRKKVYELIPELTAPWVDQSKSITNILNDSVPVVSAGHFLTKVGTVYLSFTLSDIIDWITKYEIDSKTIEKLNDMGVRAAIRQQGSPQDRERWNGCMQQVYQKLLRSKVKAFYKETPVPEGATMLERLRIVRSNERELFKLEGQYKDELAKLCGSLFIDKSVGEMTNIGAAKAA